MVKMSPSEARVCRIVKSAPAWIQREGVHAFYCMHGGHGHELPSSLENAGRALRGLEKKGVLRRVRGRSAAYVLVEEQDQSSA